MVSQGPLSSIAVIKNICISLCFYSFTFVIMHCYYHNLVRGPSSHRAQGTAVSVCVSTHSVRKHVLRTVVLCEKHWGYKEERDTEAGTFRAWVSALV